MLAALDDPRRAARAAFGLVLAATGLHLVYAHFLPLTPQETYYWQYARHLDWSYFDHPPLAAWTIRATTLLFGDGEGAIRLAAALHSGIFCAFLYLAVKELFGPRAAVVTLAAALATPLFALGQVVVTPDGPLLAGWAAALFFTARALVRERGVWLVAAGAAVGFAALGKYTAWILPPQILAALLLDSRGRKLLRTPWPYLGVVLSLALFAPVLYWNWKWDWPSFRYQLVWRGATMAPFSPRRVVSFLGLQAGAMTPVLYAVIWAAVIGACRRWRDPSLRLCALFSLPVLAIFALASPFSWVKGNWPAPAYPAALAAAAFFFLEAPRERARLAGATAAVALLVTLYVHLAPLVPALPFPPKADTTTGWKELAARVEEERRKIDGPSFVMGCEYKPASELAYYLPGRPETYSSNAMQEEGLQYDFWFKNEGILGRDGIVVLDERDYKWCLRREQFCQPLYELEPLSVYRGAGKVTTFQLWRCHYVNSMLGSAG